MAQSLTWQDHRRWRWRRHAVPLLVWLVAAIVAGGLFVYRSSNCGMAGIARPEQREVSALTDGRLRLVSVALLQPVKEGQPLAVLEDDRIQASLATAVAEVSRLRADLVATEDRLTIDAAVQRAEHVAEARRYAVDVEKNRLHEMELRMTIETDRIKLDFLRIQKDLLGKLREQRAVSELKFRSAEAAYGAQEKSIAENEKALAQVRKDLEQARRRQDSFAQNRVGSRAIDKALEPLRAAVTVQERRIGELSIEHSMLVLKSPMDGVVSQLLRGAGESVRIGEPIMTVTATQPSVVVAYTTAAQAVRLEAGSPVRFEVARGGAARHIVATQVEAVGPMAEKLPAQLWRNPTIPEWGWPVKIAIPPGLEILCGEIVGVSGP